ncbi:MAG: TonB family protein [bacterium]|nr:TonB family protein [bacterium]
MKDSSEEKLYLWEKFLFYFILIIGLLISIYPFFWMTVTSVKTDKETLGNPLSLPSHVFRSSVDVEISEISGMENITPPQIKKATKPKYLKEAKKDLIMGTVRIKGKIDATGKVMESESKISFQNIVNKPLQEEALAAFNRTEFIPAEKDNQPVDSEVEVSYEFTLAGIHNFKRVLHEEPYFFRFFLNSVYVSLLGTILSLLLTAMAAFAFARFEFKGKEFIFSMFLATMMIPGQMLLIPHFLIVAKYMKLYNTYAALILPGLANVFNIFLLRQFFKSIPQDLFDAAAIDGATVWGSFWRICIPLSKTILVTTGLFAFIFQWNAFIWPLIITTSPEIRPIQVGLSTFSGQSGSDWNLLMAASFISIFPLVILYFFAQKQIIQSLARTGLKG